MRTMYIFSRKKIWRPLFSNCRRGRRMLMLVSMMEALTGCLPEQPGAILIEYDCYDALKGRPPKDAFRYGYIARVFPLRRQILLIRRYAGERIYPRDWIWDL